MSHVDPCDWPKNYELNDELVLMSKNMGLIWVPPNEELQREIIFAHHDG
jgi:hypothetical protein